MIIFATDDGRDSLRNNKSFFVDGTFKSCPGQFTQLYTIHVDLGSNDQEVNIVVAAFALLQRKDTATYERLFSVLKEKCQFNPDSVIIDFEAAAIIALKNVFNDVDINGCHFHFAQCLWRNVQKIGLTTDYREDENVRMCVVHLTSTFKSRGR
ncbi:hypothetical protein JTE90_027112 [Oedothorax gibbosus]|uniref:MULE transposase domain-containing protein n=1 Tax=Oedothorax gibbosus TaxID=931172 RepID=A0AAV6TU53_9ARAC|nr:hypothetical protein JTE90_027112 [Oedothorax gibbosus]